MDGNSLNISQELLEKLKELVPQAFSEEKVDMQKLQTLLGEAVNTDSERYQLSWAGKSEAYKVLQMPTTATLIPQPEQSVNWDEAENIFIEGENLEVLKVLQKSYYGKIKMIYIDPPYNTGNDSFIYPDKFSETKEEYLKRIGEKDEEGYMMKEGLFRKNSKENGQFHSNWLNMMLPRLFLARNLLKDDGVIFVSIDDNEQANLKLLMDEVFGEENFIAQFIWKRRQTTDSRNQNRVSIDHEYILSYGKSSNTIFKGKSIDVEKYKNPDNDPRGPWASIDLSGLANKDQRPNLHYDLINPNTGDRFAPNPNRGWSKSPSTMDELIKENRILWPSQVTGRPREKKFLKDLNNDFTGFSTYLSSDQVGYTTDGTRSLAKIFSQKVFDFPKPEKLLKVLIEQGSEENDLILDFFAGSGTTAHATIELNEELMSRRKFICVQIPEKTDEDSEANKSGFKTIAEIAESRIKHVIDEVNNNRNNKFEFSGYQQLGFRKYSLSSSNFKIWRGDILESEEDLEKQMSLFITPQRATAQTENILWELLIKNGVPLTEKIQQVEVGEGAIVYHTSDKRFAFILDKYTPEVQGKVLALKPRTVICLDSLFQNQDMVKTNAQLKFEDNDITFKTV
jgi:adenine-specific DNA-methyltransferase